MLVIDGPLLQSEAELDAALRLLKDLAENQSTYFMGAEAGLFELLFKLRENPSRNVSVIVR